MKKTVLLLLLSTILFPISSSIDVLTLEALESAVRMNNSEVIEAQQHLIQADLDVRQAKASRFGSLEASLGFQYMANPPIGPITTNTDTIFSQLTLPPGFTTGPNQYITLYDGMENTLFDSSLTYSLPLFTWGKINASIDLYESLKLVKEAQLREKMGEMNSEIQVLLSTLYHLNTIKNLLDEQKMIANRLISISKNSLDVGIITSLDYKETQAKLLSIDEAQIQIQFQKDEVIAKLEKISGYQDIDKSIISDSTKLSDIVSYANISLKELIHMGHSRSMPLISGLEQAEKTSQALLDVAKGNLYGKPDLALQVSLGYSGSRIPFIETDWYGQDDYTFNVSIGMKSNLFNGRKAVTEAAKAKSDILIQKAKTLDGKNTIAAEIKKYRNEIINNNKLINIIEQKRAIYDEKTRILEQEVKLGVSDEASLLTHKITSIQEAILFEQTLLKMKVSYYSLLHITSP